MSYYGYDHRSRKWWTRIFFSLLEVTCINAHAIYKLLMKKDLPVLSFKEALVKELFALAPV